MASLFPLHFFPPLPWLARSWTWSLSCQRFRKRCMREGPQGNLDSPLTGYLDLQNDLNWPDTEHPSPRWPSTPHIGTYVLSFFSSCDNVYIRSWFLLTFFFYSLVLSCSEDATIKVSYRSRNACYCALDGVQISLPFYTGVGLWKRWLWANNKGAYRFSARCSIRPYWKTTG